MRRIHETSGYRRYGGQRRRRRCRLDARGRLVAGRGGRVGPALSTPGSDRWRARRVRSSQCRRTRQFCQLRGTIATYTGVARREADRGSRALLQRGVFRAVPLLLPALLSLTGISRLPSGWSIGSARPLLVGNTIYNLALPETINQGGWDRLGGRPDPTCFSASTQILLARRYPVTYVNLAIQLATTSTCTFAGGDTPGALRFLSTNLYRSLESVLLQTAFDTYFRGKARGPSGYVPGDELKLHRQVFGPARPPRNTTSGSGKIAAFRKAFVTSGGNTPSLGDRQPVHWKPRDQLRESHRRSHPRSCRKGVLLQSMGERGRAKDHVRTGESQHFWTWREPR